MHENRFRLHDVFTTQLHAFGPRRESLNVPLFPRFETNYRCSVKPSSRGGAILRIIDDMLEIAYVHRRFVDDLDERRFPFGSRRREITVVPRRFLQPHETSSPSDLERRYRKNGRRSSTTFISLMHVIGVFMPALLYTR